MKRKLCMMSVALVLLSPGCNTGWKVGDKIVVTPNQRLKASRDVFGSTVRTLTALKRQGVISKEQAAEITPWVLLAQQGLDRWQAALELGLDTTGPKLDFSTAMTELRVAENKAAPKAPEDKSWLQ